MTLTRRIALFIAALLLLALSGALIIHTLAAREALLAQQDMRNRDAAATLALAMSQQRGDTAAMRAMAGAQFDLGHYRRIRLVPPGGGAALFDLQQPGPQPHRPAWFGRLLPMDGNDGTALVGDGWRELGTLHVAAHSAWAQESLWRASVRSAGLLALLAVAAGLATTWMLRAWRQPLQATVAQAQALAEGRFLTAPLPALPELRTLTRSMNTTVQRLQDTFAHQAGQVAYLQRQAQLDPATGLALRASLVQAVAQQLDSGIGGGLVHVRIDGLDRLNERDGRAAADRLLRRLGEAVAHQGRSEPHSVAGRSAGTELALLLPVPGLGQATAASLRQALQAVIGEVDPAEGAVPLNVTVAGQEFAPGDARDAETLLAAGADALARAASQPGGVWSEPLPPGAADALAEITAQVRAALADGAAVLGSFAVRDAAGALVHLESPLRLRLRASGDAPQPASRWLTVARRAGLSPQVDATAIALALDAIAADGMPRAVNAELSSLAAPGFVDAIDARLAARPAAASRLSIEWLAADAVGAQQGGWDAAVRASARWRAHGVRLGVEHAGSAPEQLVRLRDSGLDYVKVAGAHLRGIAADPAARAYAGSLAALVRLLGLKVVAEGIDDAQDLAELWTLGFDGATGRAVAAATS